MTSILRRAAFACLVVSLFGGCAANSKKDPLEPLNRGIYHFNDAVDKVVMKPAATVYKNVAPQPVQTGVNNFFANISDVLIGFNDLLQLKVPQAVSDGGRVLINTSFGIFGLFDIASRAGMQKHNEDVGQTLGYWGMGNGPFLMLPLLGPSTLRDSAGLLAERQADPLTNGIDNVPQRNRALALKMVNRRATLLDMTRMLDEAALDPYQFLRDAYLQQRRSLVYDGNPPLEPEENGDDNDDAPQSAPSQSQSRAQPPVAEKAPTAEPAKPTVVRLWLPPSGNIHQGASD